MRSSLLALGIGLFFLSSCRDTKTQENAQTVPAQTETKEVIREVHVERVEVEKEDGILERAGKKIDKKVNREIDKKIDEID